MEGNSNRKPNEQGGDSIASNATNDWRSQHQPNLRKQSLFVIVEKLKEFFPNHGQTEINKTAVKFEDDNYRMAANKDDYIIKIAKTLKMTEEKIRKAQSNNLQSRSLAVNGTDTSGPAAQVLNQGQSLPTSLPYTHTQTSQQVLPQKMQSTSSFPTQVPTTFAAAQNANIQMGEGAHSNLVPGSQRQIQGRQHHLPQQQQLPQGSSYMFQNQVEQHLPKESIRHGNLRPPYMQQQAQPPPQQQQQSLLKQPIHQTSFASIQQSFPQSSALSTLPSSGQQNSQFLPRHQYPTQRVHPSHQQQMAVPSQEQKQQHLITQLMNIQDTQQNHVRPRQNNGEQQQGAFRVSSSQISSFQAAMPQQSNNLQNMHQEQRFVSHSSALPSQQQQNIGNFNVPGSSLLGTQGQEVGQSQPMMLQQYQTQHPVQQQQPQPQNRILQQRLDETQRFQAAGSLRQTQNVADQQNQPYQLQRTAPANPSTSQDSTGKTVNVSGGDWQEETYQKIKALKETHIALLCTMLQKVTEKLRQIDSLPREMMQGEPTEKLRGVKSTLEQLIVFLNVRRNGITEKHRDRFSMFEEHVLRLTRRTGTQRPTTQQQQGQLQSQNGQVHVSQSLDNDQMHSRLMPSHHQNVASSSLSGLTTSQTAMPHSLQTMPKMETRDENVVLPSLKQNPASHPQTVHLNISSIQSSLSQQQQPRQVQPQLLKRKQHQQQLEQPNQQIQTNETNDARIKQGINVKAGLLQQHLSSSQLTKPMASPGCMSNSSPATVSRNGTTSLYGGSPFVTPSPVTSFAPSSPVHGDPEKPIAVESPVSRSCQFQTAVEERPPFTVPPQPITERPIDRLIKAFQSSSERSLAQSLSEMSSVISLSDMLSGSVHSIGGSRAGVAEDLSARTQFRLQQGEANPTKRLKRSICALPLDIASQNDSYKQFSSLESEVDSTASSGSKVNKVEPGFALLQEIKETNGRLVETVVNIRNEDVYPSEVTSGTIVTCSYSPVALSATFEAHYKSGQISQIQPLRLLVPADYPNSPIFLQEKIPFEPSVHEHEDLSARARSRFSLSMKEFSAPMSLKEIAQAWDACARATMAEYADRHGGGTFSSKYGHWETLLRAS
ncbi:unnamed protein product [Thlaspi arvense]|uniref:Mediator complex subunit 15 KIX domain-containing protein n=1 Tax=Thlaspi arvense TaxID=13288 RepID=A0AAU9RQK9_THLAR|nr:unnamed protein product [Thlaspi arvense]